MDQLNIYYRTPQGGEGGVVLKRKVNYGKFNSLFLEFSVLTGDNSI